MTTPTGHELDALYEKALHGSHEERREARHALTRPSVREHALLNVRTTPDVMNRPFDEQVRIGAERVEIFAEELPTSRAIKLMDSTFRGHEKASHRVEHLVAMGDRPSALALVESPDVFIEAMMADSLEGDGAAGIINFLSWNEQVISRSDKDELYERPVRIGSRRHSLREWLAIALWYSNDKPDAEDLPASEIVHVGWDDPEEGRAFLGELVEGRRMPRISQADLTRARVRLTRRQARRDEAKSRNAAELARIRERLAVRKDDLDLG